MTVRGSNPGGGDEILRARPDRPWGPPSILYSGYRIRQPGRGVDRPRPPSVEVKESVELYLYTPLWSFVVCSSVNFTLYLYLVLVGGYSERTCVNISFEDVEKQKEG